MISLLSSSGEAFKTTFYPCMHCKTLAHFIEEDPDVDCIPLPNVTSTVLDKILSFFDDRLRVARELTHSQTLHNEDELTDEQQCRLRFASMTCLQNESTEILLVILTAANYLHCDLLIDLISSIIASRITGKSREEMRTILGIESDFSKEEEAQILAETAWAFVH